ncbi:MAG: sugar epimerase [Idiomarina sp.]|uniref:SDR family oxidoreductase n=1 Tax=Idiomarina sp. TaxID=1874361 RepID=UPI000C107990|nr:SDR family oxidoreductase [Idiomarina sp.]MAK70600.1 sugar epimerase [Idiomarinaceae bacterium]MBL4742194.1 SDR family oxidoreductase [Idiomarina sp.]MBT41411.1 sugar epimerase [Idiomarina sp.]PHQ77178.1 MAG: sugar epimerase [Idiomarina sp.]
MRVAVVGANGKIGQRLVGLLQQENEHEALALVRKQEQLEQWQRQGVEARLLDLEGPVVDLKSRLTGVDAIVFAAGSGGSSGDDKTLLVDLDGAIKTMEAAQESGIKRFIMVSAWQANNRENWADELKPYYAAKHYADRELMRSDLSWTVVRPGALTDEKGTGRVDIGEHLPAGSIPREDVAHVLLGCLKNNDMVGKAFDVMSAD